MICRALIRVGHAGSRTLSFVENKWLENLILSWFVHSSSLAISHSSSRSLPGYVGRERLSQRPLGTTSLKQLSSLHGGAPEALASILSVTQELLKEPLNVTEAFWNSCPAWVFENFVKSPAEARSSSQGGARDASKRGDWCPQLIEGTACPRPQLSVVAYLYVVCPQLRRQLQLDEASPIEAR